MRGVPLAGQQPLRLHLHLRLTGRQPQVEVRPSQAPPLHGKALALAVS